jgi:hypothetical protein
LRGISYQLEVFLAYSYGQKEETAYMSPVKPQILAAISGAVQAYIQEEEAMLAVTAVPPGLPLPAPPANLWGISGRQWSMQTRQLMQRRSLR